MKYDCNKTADFLKERQRMCDTYSNCLGCPYVTPDMGCAYCRNITQEHIDIVQKWSDDHPEKLKLSKREYEFLTTFTPGIDKKAIERIPNKGLYIVFYHEMNDPWEGCVDGYAEGYRINSEFFKFVNEGERWDFDKLLGLEVEE